MKIRIRVFNRSGTLHRPVFMLALILSLGLYLLLNFLPKPSLLKTEQPEITAADRILPPLIEHNITITSGQTLSDILLPLAFSPSDIHKLRNDVKPVYDLAKIKAGQKLRLYCHADRTPAYLEYDIDHETYLFIQPDQNGYRAEIRVFPVETRICLIWGTIEDILIHAVSQAGENIQLAIELTELFAWDVDFYADIRSGDSFRAVFEKKYLYDEFIGYGRIFAAEFINQGKKFEAFRYTDPANGKSDYFNFDGKSLRKEFLKSPIKSARISSRFSHSRLHPVRKIYRPHYGVDYAAPIGTPAQATADGTVTFVGRNGSAGRMVRIRHKNAYETMYLHLSRYGRGIRRGAKVTSGQVIGYVGASGEVSGPHLDYRIRHHGTFINPLSYRFKPVAPLPDESIPAFQEQAAVLRMALDGPLLVMRWLANMSIYPGFSEITAD